MNTLIPGAFGVLLLVCGGLKGVGGAPTAGERTKESASLVDEFSNSLRLSRRLLQESRVLTRGYRMWKLPGAHLDFTGSSQSFPSISISSNNWLRLQKGDRLRLLNEALQVFPVYLEELEKWESDDDGSFEEEDQEGPLSHLMARVTTVRLDLRDLLHHIQLQMSTLGITPPKPLIPEGVPTDGHDWCSRVQMYQALSSMEKILARAVREYTVLRRISG